MNPQTLLRLCSFTYLNLPELYARRLGRGETVTLAEVARKVTGSWTFDTHGFPWTADDTITVPVTSDPNAGPTLYIANTSPTFTSCV